MCYQKNLLLIENESLKITNGKIEHELDYIIANPSSAVELYVYDDTNETYSQPTDESAETSEIKGSVNDLTLSLEVRIIVVQLMLLSGFDQLKKLSQLVIVPQ